MVKAPRSKGCRTCVQRRVKCYLTRPFCTRCHNAGRECSGFEVRIVNEEPRIQALYNVNEDVVPGHGSFQVPLRVSTRGASESGSSSDGASTHWSARNDAMYHGTLEKISLISDMAPASYQTQLLSVFVASTEQSDIHLPSFPTHSLWLARVCERATISKELVWSIRAISVSHLAKMACDDDLVETARRMYGKALVLLSVALQDDEEGLFL